MKTNIKDIYKYMLDNGRFYTVKTKNKEYYNVLCLNKGLNNGESRIIYLWNLNNLEVMFILGTIQNKDIQQVTEQEEFIYW